MQGKGKAYNGKRIEGEGRWKSKDCAFPSYAFKMQGTDAQPFRFSVHRRGWRGCASKMHSHSRNAE